MEFGSGNVLNAEVGMRKAEHLTPDTPDSELEKLRFYKQKES
jgi:hypothetical protein